MLVRIQKLKRYKPRHLKQVTKTVLLQTLRIQTPSILS